MHARSYSTRAIRGAIGTAIALVALASSAAAGAAVIAEGIYTISAPEHRTLPFRMVLTPTGARIAPTGAETLVFSYAEKTALVLDSAARSYFPLPLDLVPPLLATGLGYDPRGLGATASGATRTILGKLCSEVVVSGKAPKLTLRSWRLTDPIWSRDYTRLELALGLPWTAAGPPAAFVGLPLAGSVEIEGARPYRAEWQVTRLSREEGVDENFTVPDGYRMDLERLLSAKKRR